MSTERFNITPEFLEAVRVGLRERDRCTPKEELVQATAKWLWTNTLIAVGSKRSVRMTENPHYLGRNVATIPATICRGGK